MTTVLIGVCGYRGAGKTTVFSKAICDDRSLQKALPVHMIGFASPITEMLSVLIRPEVLRNKERWNEPLPELCGRSTRYAAETLGTEWGCDHMGNDLWARIAFSQADDVIKAGVSVVIDGIRKHHEAEEIRKRNGILIAFHRENLVVDLGHDTERHIAAIQRTCNFTITNYDNKMGVCVQNTRQLLTALTA